MNQRPSKWCTLSKEIYITFSDKHLWQSSFINWLTTVHKRKKEQKQKTPKDEILYMVIHIGQLTLLKLRELFWRNSKTKTSLIENRSVDHQYETFITLLKNEKTKNIIFNHVYFTVYLFGHKILTMIVKQDFDRKCLTYFLRVWVTQGPQRETRTPGRPTPIDTFLTLPFSSNDNKVKRIF